MDKQEEKAYSLEDCAYIVLPESSTKRLASMGTVIEIPKNHTIYKAGDVSDYCYLLLEGRVKVHEYSYDGADRIYKFCTPGTLMLELCTVLHQKLPLNFTSTKPCRLAKISRDELLKEIRNGGEVTLDMFMSICEKFTGMMEQLRESNSHCVEWKLSNLLLSYARRFGKPYDGKVIIEEKMSQQMIANLLRVNRMTVARALNSLKENNLVENINGLWCIRDEEKLRKHMDYLDSFSVYN